MSDTTKDAEKGELRREVAAIPAIFIDSYNLTVWPGHFRITFGESLGGKLNFRQAMVMEVDDAAQLAKDILEVAEKAKQPQSTDATLAAGGWTREPD